MSWRSRYWGRRTDRWCQRKKSDAGNDNKYTRKEKVMEGVFDNLEKDTDEKVEVVERGGGRNGTE